MHFIFYLCTIICNGRICDKSTYAKCDGKSDTVIFSTVTFSPGREYACTPWPIWVEYRQEPLPGREICNKKKMLKVQCTTTYTVYILSI